MQQTEIGAFAGTPFTELEIELVRDICLDQSYETIESLLSKLTLYVDPTADPLVEKEGTLQARRKMFRSYLAVFFDEFDDGTISVVPTSGNGEGTDYSNVRDKAELRFRVRRALGLPVLVTTFESLQNPVETSDSANVIFVP